MDFASEPPISSQQLANNVRMLPSQFSSLRQDSANNFDLSALWVTRVRENFKAQLRAECFNALTLNATSSSFGQFLILWEPKEIPRGVGCALGVRYPKACSDCNGLWQEYLETLQQLGVVFRQGKQGRNTMLKQACAHDGSTHFWGTMHNRDVLAVGTLTLY